MSALLKRITFEDGVCNGRPVIRGHRLTVQTVLEFLFAGTSEDELIQQYPFLEKDDIQACKEFVLLLVNNKFSVVDFAA
jgi:uncharacterized protein (DUF433 family)